MGPKRSPPADLVPHPRFGTAYSPEASIPADLSRQNFTAFPLEHYADKLSRCRDCRRSFVFYAQEQKYWYEDLGFHVSVACPARCSECRRTRHRRIRRFQRYSLLIRKGELTERELAILVGDAVMLYESGILEDEQRLRRLKNLAVMRIPEDPATKEILALIAGIPVVCGHRLSRAESQVLRAIIRLIDGGAEAVTEGQAISAAIPPDNLDLGTVPSYTRAFARLMRRGLLTLCVPDRTGSWRARPTEAVMAGLQ